MAKMNNNLTLDAVVDEFLAEYENPNAELWKELTRQYPEYASDITDYAMIYSGMSDLSESDVNSELGEDVYEASVSSALEMALKSPNVILPILKEISNIRGKMLKDLVVEIGLERAPKLLSEILRGVTIAPKAVLMRLAKKFDTSEAIMLACLQKRFENSAVPSYKAGSDKPEINTKQRTWEESVHLLNLDSDDAAALIDMDQ